MQDRVERPGSGSISAAGDAPGVAPRPLIRLDGVGYRAGRNRILSGVTLEICEGRPTALLGPNGSGKTTLLKLLMGLVTPSEGHLAADALAAMSREAMAFVLQRPVMLRRSAGANVAYALQAAGHAPTLAAIDRILAQVSLGHLRERPARKLSAGEQQRLAIARALARTPRVLLLDEPTASLDPSATKAVEEIVAAASRDGVKVVIATHDLGQARRLAGDVVLLVGGSVAERGAAATFFAEPQTPIARRFLAGELVL
ncbi:MAG: ATP-binding cassette domain-containing protein [Hyphomicrobiaceae bacterium]